MGAAITSNVQIALDPFFHPIEIETLFKLNLESDSSSRRPPAPPRPKQIYPNLHSPPPSPNPDPSSALFVTLFLQHSYVLVVVAPPP